jgi:hypothetical protein
MVEQSTNKSLGFLYGARDILNRLIERRENRPINNNNGIVSPAVEERMPNVSGANLCVKPSDKGIVTVKWIRDNLTERCESNLTNPNNGVVSQADVEGIKRAERIVAFENMRNDYHQIASSGYLGFLPSQVNDKGRGAYGKGSGSW